MADYRRLPCRRIVQQLPFISLNNGVNWQKGSSAMQLPDYFPHLTGADGIVADSYLKADLSDAWKRMPSRSAGRWMKPSYSVDGDNITRECPYIYFTGGTLPGEAHVVRDMERRAGSTHIHSYNLTNKLILHHPNTQKFEHKSINHHSGDSDAGSVGFLRQSP